MSVVVAIEDVGVCRKQVRVEVPAPAVEAETRRVAEEFRRSARLPGFRKGRVPLELVRKRFERDIRQEVLDRLIPRYWRQAQAESGVEPLLPPQVEEVDLEPDAPLTFSATVEVRPEISIGDLESFELPDPPGEPSSEEVEVALEDLRRSRSEWTDAGREAAQGDLVGGRLVELSGEGEAVDEGRAMSFEVGHPRAWEELTLAVTGQVPGREVEFEREGDEKAKSQRFRFSVDSVQQRELPPLDDEFASSLGKFENLEALRADLTMRLRQAKQEEGRRKREEALLDQLRQRHPLELPSRVVEHESEKMLREYAESLARQGLDLERAGIDWQGLAREMRPRAEKRVHARLLLDAVAEKLGIQVSESEFEASLAAIARAEGRSTPEIRQALDRSGRLGELRSQMLRGKTVKRLLGEAEGAELDEREEGSAAER